MKQSTNKLKSDYQGQSMIPVGSERDHLYHEVDKFILARQG